LSGKEEAHATARKDDQMEKKTNETLEQTQKRAAIALVSSRVEQNLTAIIFYK